MPVGVTPSEFHSRVSWGKTIKWWSHQMMKKVFWAEDQTFSRNSNVPGAYPGHVKMCKKCAKITNFLNLGVELLGNGWRWLHGITCCDAFDKHWILLSSMWHLRRLSQGRTHYPGRPKCALGLRLIAETDARSVGGSRHSCINVSDT